MRELPMVAAPRLVLIWKRHRPVIPEGTLAAEAVPATSSARERRMALKSFPMVESLTVFIKLVWVRIGFMDRVGTGPSRHPKRAGPSRAGGTWRSSDEPGIVRTRKLRAVRGC